MRLSLIIPTLLAVVRAFDSLSSLIHEDIEAARILDFRYGRLVKRGSSGRLALSSSPETSQGPSKRQRQQSSPRPRVSQKGSESTSRSLSNSGTSAGGTSRSGPSGSRPSNSRSPNRDLSVSRSPSRGTSRSRSLSSWHSSSSSSDRSSPDSENSQSSIMSSPATSQQRRHPVSVSTTTTGPAMVSSFTGRTLQQQFKLKRIPSGGTKSMIAMHPKKASIEVEHLSSQAHTESIARGRNPRLEAQAEIGDNPTFTAMIPHRRKPLEVHKGPVDGHDIVEHDNYSHSYKKGAHIIGVLEGKGIMRTETQNSPWKLAPI